MIYYVKGKDFLSRHVKKEKNFHLIWGCEWSKIFDSI